MNQKGVMLIDMMLGFSLFCMVVALFPLFLQVSPISSSTSSLYEKTIFFNQLAMELREAVSLDVENDTLILVKANGSSVVYEKYGSFLRRRVDGKGHEIILTHLQQISYVSVGHGIVVKLTDDYDQEFEKRLSLPYIFQLQETG